MFARPFLASIALVGTLLGATIAASAQNATYPLPPAPAAGANASNGAPANHRHHGRMHAALAAVGLSSAQRSQIKSINKAFRASRQTTNPMTPQDRRSQIEAVLTTDQRTTFDHMMRRHRPANPDQGNSAPPPAPNS